MSGPVLEELTRQYIEAQPFPGVTFSWQGGEPLMMGIGFFERALGFQAEHGRPGTRIGNDVRTNATLIDDDWCDLFRSNNFIVEVSLDGPGEMHDAYRRDRDGEGSFDRVMEGVQALKDHGIEFDVKTAIHRANMNHPLEVYGFLRDEVGARSIRFIPIVERVAGSPEPAEITPRSVLPESYGEFLIRVFDEWIREDIGEMHVQAFEVALAGWTGVPHDLCVHSPTCGRSLVLEHNGDLYSCDHFVDGEHLLGNITEGYLGDMVSSTAQSRFGEEKISTLPRRCLECEYRFACHGGCPKDRFLGTPNGRGGHNYLCEGYRAFFRHVDEPMRFMADDLFHGGRSHGRTNSIQRDGAPEG